MGAGLCVLTSDVPENREVVEGVGFTFARGNVTDLAQRLRFLIANPAVREAAGRMARKRVETDHQWAKIAEDIEETYFKILGRESGVAAKKPTARATAVGQTQTGRRAS